MTRIVAADDKTNYDSVAISLHWATALLVLFQFVSAETWGWVAKPTRHTLQGLHVSFGILLTAVIVARVLWPLIPGHQRPSIASGWMETASNLVRYMLYALLIAQAGLGFAFRWAQGKQFTFFGLFSVPNPLAPMDRLARHTLGDLHYKAGWAIIIIAVAHALAALYHHYALHDRELGRMLPFARRSEQDARAP